MSREIGTGPIGTRLSRGFRMMKMSEDLRPSLAGIKGRTRRPPAGEEYDLADLQIAEGLGLPWIEPEEEEDGSGR